MTSIVEVNYLQARRVHVGQSIDEGLLYDLLTKRRGGKFTADELLWAADHPEVIRWVMTNLAIVQGISGGRLMVDKSPRALQVSYDQSLGLIALVERAVGHTNLCNIHYGITQERFKFTGTGVRSVKCRVEPYFDDETSEQAAQRLVATGRILGNIGDLAAFLHSYPAEVEKWRWVLAISKSSHWVYPFNCSDVIDVPSVRVQGASRYFGFSSFRDQRNSSFRDQYNPRDGVLVLCE